MAAAAPGAAGFARLRAGNHLLGTGNTGADFHPRNRRSSGTAQRRLQLLQDYPDAVIESERDFASTTATAAVCRAVFVFCANIAEPRSAPAASG